MAKTKGKRGRPPIDDAQVRERLDRAQREQLPVRLHRWIPGANSVEGFVSAVGELWVLLALQSEAGQLDGWTAVRIDDVQRVKLHRSADRVEVRSLQLHGQWPLPSPPSLDLDVTAALVRGAGAAAPLICVHTEFDRTDVFWVGRVKTVSQDELTLQEVQPDASWDLRPSTGDLQDLTRIDVGRAYADLLHRLAGAAPRGSRKARSLS